MGILGSALVYSGSGLAVSEEPYASMIGARILEHGGNAVDAAVAVSMALAVTVPHLGGVGGDFFALVREPSGKTWFVNGSGAAPRMLTRSLFVERGLSRVPRGPLSPTVPGMIDGLHLMWRSGGALEWRDLVAPAARLASQGFPASPTLAEAVERNRELLMGDEGSAETYLAHPPREGEAFRLPGLARLLEMVAEDPRVFYEGEPGELLAEYVSSRGGVLAHQDLRLHRGYLDEPLQASYRGWRVWETPPNTQGAATLQLLAMLEEEEMPQSPGDPRRLELLAKLAPPLYEWRNRYLGDPGAMVLDRRRLVNPEIIEEIKRLEYTGCGSPSITGDTTFFAVVDSEGRVVAGIQSLFHHFGSGLTEPTYQVTLNDRGLGFTLEPGRPSTLEPGRRPLHTLSALIMESPEGATISLGASAGHLRPQIYAWLASNVIDYEMSILEAISYPRAAWDPERCLLLVEKGLGIPAGIPLAAREKLGVASAVMIRGEARAGSSDLRGAGIPVPALYLEE